jgi:hypothetical protein
MKQSCKRSGEWTPDDQPRIGKARLEKPVADNKQIMEEMRIAIERYPSHWSLEDAEKFYAELKAELQVIADRHGVPLQDWGGFHGLLERAAKINKTKG